MGSFYRSKHELIFVWKSGSTGHINNFCRLSRDNLNENGSDNQSLKWRPVAKS